MSNRVKPSAMDWMKLIGLLFVIAFVAFDVIAMRGRNKILRESLEKQMIEMDVQLKAAEKKARDEGERAETRIKEVEKKMSETRRKAVEAESEFREKARAMQADSRKALEEQKAAYEKRIQEMQEDFNSRINSMRNKTRNAVQASSAQPISPKMERCGRCSGRGEIQEKEKCATCGGSGKIGNVSLGTRRGLNRTSTSTSTVYSDCPDCLPGTFRGSGSKGYTIQRKPCPRCNGTGAVPVNR